MLIGGCNLEKEAETYRQEFQKLSQEVERYNLEMKLKQGSAPKPLSSRIRLSRSEKQNNCGFRKEGWVNKQALRKLEGSRVRDKDEVHDLMPWTVLVPEF